jgi:hypothetical protein
MPNVKQLRAIKLPYMKTNFVQQEILLMTGTSFSQRQCVSKDDQDNHELTEKEHLEEACWNGLLPEMLPEIYGQTCGDTKLYLWQIREAVSFIEIELGELPGEKEKYFSIDPYTFLQMQSLS